MSSKEIILLLHREGSSLLSVRPCDTANGSDTNTHWTTEELHCTMGCRKFCNYKTLLQVSRDGEWIDGGEFPPSLGSFATIPKAKRGLPLDKTKYFYLEAVHMDTAFGNCLSVGSFKYALILVDRATQYNWTFGLKLLSSDCILLVLLLFWASADALARCFYCDCNTKLFGTAILEYLIDNHSKVVAAPAKCQSSDGLVESPWKTMVSMAWAYLTEKQMPHNFWFYTITHATRMMNTIPGKYKDRLALPFMLVHGIGHGVRTWTLLFSLCYFHHEKNGDDTRTKHMAHTMDGVIVGWFPTSNALMVYNSRNHQYCKQDSYRIDSYQLPGSVYPASQYDGGLFCYLLCNDNPQFEEKYPAGTRVECIDPKTNMLLAGMVMDIPFPLDSTGDTSIPNNTILFNNGSTASIPLEQMAGIIPAPPINVMTLTLLCLSCLLFSG
jgi:hypothetical protein